MCNKNTKKHTHKNLKLNNADLVIILYKDNIKHILDWSVFFQNYQKQHKLT